MSASEASATGGGKRVFGVPMVLDAAAAARLVNGLEGVFAAQISSLPRSTRGHGPATGTVEQDLALLRHWFDPVAKGERIRAALSALPRLQFDLPYATEDAVLVIPNPPGDEAKQPGRRLLLTPEGVVVLHCVRRALLAAVGDGALPGDPVGILPTDVQETLLALAGAYRTWGRQRIDQVTSLLVSEPTSLRPAAAGLLLVLLINRNTAPERALPRPKQRDHLEAVSRAIAGPALAYARGLTGSDRATETGVDLYRGWALGELTRRLGPALHTGLDEGIYLEASAEDEALERLCRDIIRRPPQGRQRVADAVDAALKAYDAGRPVLAALALAHDRPSNTSRIKVALLKAARSASGTREGS